MVAEAEAKAPSSKPRSTVVESISGEGHSLTARGHLLASTVPVGRVLPTPLRAPIPSESLRRCLDPLAPTLPCLPDPFFRAFPRLSAVFARGVTMTSQLPGSSTGGASSIKERLICTVCRKLLVDAVVLNECRHIYCRACLLGHLEYDDKCADCLAHLGPNKASAFRPDPTLQELVYKLNPGHYYQEVRYRKEFAARRRLQGAERRMVLDKDFAKLARFICKEDERIPVNLVYRSPYVMGKASTSELPLPTKVKVHLKAPASTTIAQLKVIMETKTDIPDPSLVTFVDKTENSLLDESTTLRDLVYRYPISRKKPIRLAFTFLKQSPEEQEKPPVLDLMGSQHIEQPPPLQWPEDEANLIKPNVFDLSMSVTLSPSRLESCLSNNGEPAQKIININKRAVPMSGPQMPTLSPMNGLEALQKRRKKTLSPMKRSSEGELLPRISAPIPQAPAPTTAPAPQAPVASTTVVSSMPSTTTAVQMYSPLQALPIQLQQSVATTSAGNPVFVAFKNPPASTSSRPQNSTVETTVYGGGAAPQPIPIQPRPAQVPMVLQVAPSKNAKTTISGGQTMLIPVNTFALPFIQGRQVVGDFRMPQIIAPSNGNGQGMSYVFSMAPEIIRTWYVPPDAPPQ
ncbi:hypothetical protein QR680_013387 [Steinernema hermaphroditum]|uniref:RING-type domain-containing protein n=1 Tax=Steinernema hermaphroditum TaxID=289476 RepID=A0AA39M292_9BILA|nr:hypothetical protein QR680_013387 [Steinernema hermaphroditum]